MFFAGLDSQVSSGWKEDESTGRYEEKNGELLRLLVKKKKVGGKNFPHSIYHWESLEKEQELHRKTEQEKK